jgi:hypothetical protein
MMASEDAAMKAQLSPEHLLALRGTARKRGQREQAECRHEHTALAEAVGGPAAEHEEAGERDRVRVDHPLQVGRGEVQARLDRRQGDVDDAQVEDDHELSHAADGQQQTGPCHGRSLRRGGGSCPRLLGCLEAHAGAPKNVAFADRSAVVRVPRGEVPDASIRGGILGQAGC